MRSEHGHRFCQTSISLCCCLLISGCCRDSLTWASHSGAQIYMEFMYLQKPTLTFASYSPGMIQCLAVFTKWCVWKEYVNVQILWTQDLCYCQMQFENKQQLTVSLFCFNLFKTAGCFLWIHQWQFKVMQTMNSYT